MYFAVNVSDDSPNGEEHDVHSHMFRPTMTDMQDKCCGNCYDVYYIQSQYKGNHKTNGMAEDRRTSFMVRLDIGNIHRKIHFAVGHRTVSPQNTET